VGPGIPMPDGTGVGSGVTTVMVGCGVKVGDGVGVAGGAGWEHPAISKKMAMRTKLEGSTRFFMI
jgi:hypothetical protein